MVTARVELEHLLGQVAPNTSVSGEMVGDQDLERTLGRMETNTLVTGKIIIATEKER